MKRYNDQRNPYKRKPLIAGLRACGLVGLLTEVWCVIFMAGNMGGGAGTVVLGALACKFKDLREVPKKYEPATVASIYYPNPGELVRLVPGGQHILEDECQVSGRRCLKKSRRIAFEK